MKAGYNMTHKKLKDIVTVDILKLEMFRIHSNVNKPETIKYIKARVDVVVSNVLEWNGLIVAGKNGELKKHHTIFQNGNGKIDRSTICQSIIPILSCGHYCKFCYAANTCVNGLYGLNVTETWLTWYEIEKLFPEHYFAQVRYELAHTRKKDVRLHVSGDFIDEHDYNEWLNVVREYPEKRFYTYSKRPYINRDELPENINVVDSCPCGHSKNYGSDEFLETIVSEIKAEYNVSAWVCKCGTEYEKEWNRTHKGRRYCGGECKHCLTDRFVVFHEHN